MKQWIAIMTVLALAACADPTAAPPKLNIVADNYCAIAKKRTWSVNDTWQSIEEARRENAKIDKLCGAAGEKAKPDPKTS